MRLWNAVKRLARETAMLTITMARQIGRPRVILTAAAIAILAALIIWDASADAPFTRTVSNRAGLAAW